MVVWWWKNINWIQNIQLNHLSLHNLWILPYTNDLSHHWTLGGIILCIIFFKSIYTINYRQQGYKNVRWTLRKNLGLKTAKFRSGSTLHTLKSYTGRLRPWIVFRCGKSRFGIFFSKLTRDSGAQLFIHIYRLN